MSRHTRGVVGVQLVANSKFREYDETNRDRELEQRKINEIGL
jgi:hypothetical protein